MLAKVNTFALSGLDGYKVEVEVDLNQGLPGVEMVGLASASVREAKERIRSAIKNVGYTYPLKRITVNLAPADTRKDGSTFDLPIAIGILAASGQIEPAAYKTETGNGDGRAAYKEFIIMGELSLNGELRKIDGVLPLVISAYQQGFTKFILPAANAAEASFIEGIDVYAAKSLREVVELLNGETSFLPVPHKKYDEIMHEREYSVDFSDVKGQLTAKRALEIAVAGGHNVLLIGPPGAGKTMLSRCVPTIMPDMSFDEAIEVTKIHSVAGVLDSQVGIITVRPFRAPHHTASLPSLVGGGSSAKPGEVSLAHNGVLFLDEMPEYDRKKLESLRGPLEDRTVTVARAAKTVEYPANFMLIASMNPCPCGNYGSKTAVCKCSPTQIHNYLAKISGPLLDRIDLQIEVDSVSYGELRDKTVQESSADIKRRTNAVREICRNRFKGTGILTNSQMTNRQVKEFCALDDRSEQLLEKAFQKLNLSARATSRVLKVARTIADLDGCENIRPEHIAEAVQYRSLDRKYRN